MFGTSTSSVAPGLSASRSRTSAACGSLMCSTTCHAHATSNSAARELDVLEEPRDHRNARSLGGASSEIGGGLDPHRLVARIASGLDEVAGGGSDLEQLAART